MINNSNDNDIKETDDNQISKDHLHQLAFSDDEAIRISVALNKNTSRKTLKILQHDSSERILSNLKTRYERVPSSKTIKFRLISVSDAEFIFKLRTDEKYNKHISKVSSDVKDQIKFIEAYKKDEANADQFYFIIERLDGVRCGTVRLYNFTDDSFEWGSWILNEDKTRFAAIETAFLVYKYAFEVLGFEKSNFEVNKMNTNVIKFHKKIGAEVISEDETNYYFEMLKNKAFCSVDSYIADIFQKNNIA